MLLIVATRNLHKGREIEAALGIPGLTLKTALAIPGAPEVQESADTMEGNAILKARALALHARGWALADDSGLEVEALHGAPGVYSARYAGPHASDQDNNRKLLRALQGKQNRDACFRCVLALASPSGEVRTVSGTCHGRIATRARGRRGFGYDPLFIPRGEERSFAELEPEEKQRISHRGRALAAARCAWGAWLQSNPSDWPR